MNVLKSQQSTPEEPRNSTFYQAARPPRSRKIIPPATAMRLKRSSGSRKWLLASSYPSLPTKKTNGAFYQFGKKTKGMFIILLRYVFQYLIALNTRDPQIHNTSVHCHQKCRITSEMTRITASTKELPFPFFIFPLTYKKQKISVIAQPRTSFSHELLFCGTHNSY